MNPVPLSGPWEDDGPRILGATFTVSGIALLTFVLRGYVRIELIHSVGWDDYMMAIAMAISLAGQVILTISVKYGAGKHIYMLDRTTFQNGLKWNYVTQPIYLILPAFVKASIGFLLLRIAILRWSRRIIIGIMAFIAFYTISCLFTLLLQCTNLNVMWDRSVQGTCWPIVVLRSLSYTHASLNIITDLIFAIVIPVPMLWNLQLQGRQKLAIFGILALGLFSTAAAIARFKYIRDYGRFGDLLWDTRNISIWTIVECNVGIIAGNLSTMKPFVNHIVESTYGRGTGHSSEPKSSSTRFNTSKKHSAYDPLAGEGTRSQKDYEMRTRTTAGDSQAAIMDDVEKASIGSDKPFARGGGIMRTTEVNVDSGIPRSMV